MSLLNNPRFAAFQKQIGQQVERTDVHAYRLYDAASPNSSLRTGFFRSHGTTIVMKGRLEKAGCVNVLIEKFPAKDVGADEWEPMPFDVTGWCERWTVWNKP